MVLSVLVFIFVVVVGDIFVVLVLVYVWWVFCCCRGMVVVLVWEFCGGFCLIFGSSWIGSCRWLWGREDW